jgi:hypothetical protein
VSTATVPYTVDLRITVRAGAIEEIFRCCSTAHEGSPTAAMGQDPGNI